MRIATACVLIHALIEIDPRYPEVTEEQHQTLLEVKYALEAQAPKGAAPDPFEQRRQAKKAKAAARHDGTPAAEPAATADSPDGSKAEMR
jgi:hypothetical protein